MALSEQWCGQGPFNGPPIGIDSLRNDCARQTEFLRPLPERQCYLSASKETSAAIARQFLLFAGLPANIFRCVVTIIVEAAQSYFSKWSWSHVQKELFKRQPWAAHLNSSSPIPSISVHRGIAASANHCIPCSPFPRAVSLPSVAMSETCFHEALIIQEASFGKR